MYVYGANAAHHTIASGTATLPDCRTLKLSRGLGILIGRPEVSRVRAGNRGSESGFPLLPAMVVRYLLWLLGEETDYCLPVRTAHLIPALFLSKTIHPVNNLGPFFCGILAWVRYGMAH